MFFEWDEGKNQQNIYKHGIDFYDVRKALVETSVSVDVTAVKILSEEQN